MVEKKIMRAGHDQFLYATRDHICSPQKRFQQTFPMKNSRPLEFAFFKKLTPMCMTITCLLRLGKYVKKLLPVTFKPEVMH